MPLLAQARRFVASAAAVFSSAPRIANDTPRCTMDPVGIVALYSSAALPGVMIFITSIWPVIINTAVGVRNIPQDYRNVAKVLRLNPLEFFLKIMVPAAAPYIFTGLRIGIGLSWLAIVAAEMLTGRPGVGGFLWQQYNALVYEQIILCILTIGVVGFILDRLMSVVERRFKTI